MIKVIQSMIDNDGVKIYDLQLDDGQSLSIHEFELKSLKEQIIKLEQENKVTVITYGKAREFETREQAIKEVRTWCLCSEGSEQSRYTHVLCELLEGKKICTDGEE